MAFRCSVSCWSHRPPCGLRIVQLPCPTDPRWCMAMQMHTRIGDSSRHTSISTGGRGIAGQTSPSVATPPFVRVAQRKGPPRPSTLREASRAPLRCEGSAVDARGGRGALHPPSLSSTAHRPVSVLVRVFPPSPSEGGPCPSPRKIRHASQSFPSTPLLLVAICFSFPLPAERARPTFEPDSFRVCSFQASPIEPGSCPGQTTVSVPSQPLVTRALVLISIVSRRSKPRTRGLQGDTTDVGSGS